MAWTVWILRADAAVRCWRSTIELLGGQPQALLRDGLGAFWYASAAGLYRFDRTARRTRVGPATPLRTLLRDRSGRVWAGGSAGLFLVSDRRTLVPALATQREIGRRHPRAG
jgi:ligand-binding sensor domain-containing protein